MKQILLMIAVVALVGCGKKEPVQPSASNTEATKPEKERGKEATFHVFIQKGQNGGASRAIVQPKK